MKEKRDETIILRLSKTEKNRIYEKMLSMGIRSLSAYIRKMALDFELLSQKKAAYPEYRKAKEEMQELVRAQKNVERFFAEEKQTHETEQVR